MWSEIFKRWMDMAFWWLPRRPGETDRGKHRPQATTRHPGDTDAEAAGTQHESTASAPQEPATAARPAASSAKSAEDLTEIKGIGAAMQKKLQSHGIHRYRDLADADADALTENLRAEQVVISRARVQQWIDSARERV